MICYNPTRPFFLLRSLQLKDEFCENEHALTCLTPAPKKTLLLAVVTQRHASQGHSHATQLTYNVVQVKTGRGHVEVLQCRCVQLIIKAALLKLQCRQKYQPLHIV